MKTRDVPEVLVVFTTKDQPGLIHEVTRVIAGCKANIIDVEQAVVRGIFNIIVLCDPSTSSLPVEECFASMKIGLEELKNRVGGYLLIEYNTPEEGKRHAPPENFMKVTVLGQDSPGIIATISGIVAKYHFNIESLTQISRKDIFAMELIISHKGNKNILAAFKSALKDKIDRQRLSIIVQDEKVFDEEKKLVVFDMDSTLIIQECIEMLAESRNLKGRIARITKEAMEGRLDFKQALRERVQLLKGTPAAFLEEVAANITLTPGAKELVDTLKQMGYKVALISGGFSYFTEIMKEKLGLDYAFGNELIIKDGEITGEINENLVIDAAQKAKIQKWIAQIENVRPENIVTIGDGANDAIMIENSGIGIGFRPKTILKSVADGIINDDNMLGLMYAFGDFRKKKWKES